MLRTILLRRLVLLLLACPLLGGCLGGEPDCDEAREKYEAHFDDLVSEAKEDGGTLRKAGCDENGTFYVVHIVFPGSSLPIEVGGLTYEADYLSRPSSVVCTAGSLEEKVRAYRWDDGGVNVQLSGAPYPARCNPEENIGAEDSTE